MGTILDEGASVGTIFDGGASMGSILDGGASTVMTLDERASTGTMLDEGASTGSILDIGASMRSILDKGSSMGSLQVFLLCPESLHLEQKTVLADELFVLAWLFFSCCLEINGGSTCAASTSVFSPSEASKGANAGFMDSEYVKRYLSAL